MQDPKKLYEAHRATVADITDVLLPPWEALPREDQEKWQSNADELYEARRGDYIYDWERENDFVRTSAS